MGHFIMNSSFFVENLALTRDVTNNWGIEIVYYEFVGQFSSFLRIYFPTFSVERKTLFTEFTCIL